MLFKNREEAGRKLAELLKDVVEGVNPIVIALPRGGVPVGFEVARALGVKFSIIPVRKLGVPSNPELAFGAVDPDGDVYLNKSVVESFGLTPEIIEEIRQKEYRELLRRLELYLEGKLPSLGGREIFIVDDGFATGFTALAACGFAKKREPYKVVLSAPVAPADTVLMLKQNCADDVVVYETPEPFFAVGMFYEDFHQLTDEEVIKYRELAKELGIWEPL
ncbi:MAG TPA: phosphoribosyltransferase [Aquificales bacterium]|nr:phosphoribosyltransferase [Aquificales bacterium]